MDGLKIDIAYGDILEPNTIVDALKNCEMLFHVAGIFSYWGHDSNELINNAKHGMQNIMDAVCKSKIKRVILTSSSVTLGATKHKKVLSEDHPGDFNESLAYITSKVEQEKLAFQLAEQHDIDLVVVNPTLTRWRS